VWTHLNEIYAFALVNFLRYLKKAWCQASYRIALHCIYFTQVFSITIFQKRNTRCNRYTRFFTAIIFLPNFSIKFKGNFLINLLSRKYKNKGIEKLKRYNLASLSILDNILLLIVLHIFFKKIIDKIPRRKILNQKVF